MKKAIVIVIILVVAGFLLRRRGSEPLSLTKQVRPPVSDEHYVGDKAKDFSMVKSDGAPVAEKPHTPAPTATAQTGFPLPKDETRPDSREPLSIQTARRLAWDSMLTKPKDMDDFFEMKELSANHPAPAANEAKYFRGLRDLSDSSAKYVEMRFEGDKWIVSDGTSPDHMTQWPSRDVIPFKDQPDVWTLYYGDSLRLILKHFPKVNIPELDGDFEVLSGWLFNRDRIWRVVMIATEKGWPSEALFHELKPGH